MRQKEVPIPKLYYFDTYGRADAFKAIFRFYKVNFEDIPMRMDEWPGMKQDYEYAQLPYLEWKGSYIAQPHALLYYLGNEYKCIPKDSIDEYEMNSVICAVEDVEMTALKIYLEYKSPEERSQKLKEHYHQTVSFYIERFESKLKVKQNTGYIAGNEISLADFAIVGLMTSMYGQQDGALLKQNISSKYALFSAYVDGLLRIA